MCLPMDPPTQDSEKHTTHLNPRAQATPQSLLSVYPQLNLIASMDAWTVHCEGHHLFGGVGPAGLAAARPAGIGVGVLRRQADAGSLTWTGVPGSDLIQRQLLSNSSEQFPDVLGGLGGCLEEQKPGFPCVGFGVGSGYRSLIGLLCDQVKLIAGERDDDVLVGLALKLLDPGLGLVQG